MGKIVLDENKFKGAVVNPGKVIPELGFFFYQKNSFFSFKNK